MDENYDVVVVGGGTAGLSGAVALTRSLRSVLVVDGGDPRNAAAAHAHNFLTRDGVAPGELLALGRAEVERYGGHVIAGRVSALARAGSRFRVELADRTVTARRLLVATGARDELPDVPGLAERWGVDVLHCPYCHGYEVRGQRIGVLATGPTAAHQALLFRQLSPHVTLLRHTGPEPHADERERLDALGVPLVDGTVEAVENDGTRLTGVRLAGGQRLPLDALVVAPRFLARAELLAPLGLEPAEIRMDGHLVATRIEAGPAGATDATGVWVAGNLAEPMAQLMPSAAAGLMAGATINADLVTEDAARARPGALTG
jgi:thioredoxin reductase